ncbi:hypothetical protein O181_091900 [Austropuccinia psidii MF-1]|uniref:Uncharacterized protein n=1 Tax=Austropuccinia psidii MF-1 TaxID=1389203 RepID=A0A9Q3P8K2_9BASI|nr:hypothetical protein [Austropuccinia psidii MF-1]
MAREMLVEGNMPPHFWQYAYANACFIHNCLPNSCCPESSPYKELYGRCPSVAAIYPFGVEAIVHVPAPQQSDKLHPRGTVLRTESIFAQETAEIDSLPLPKDVSIPQHLGRIDTTGGRRAWLN